ncbi:MAG: hypothetical protein Q4A68_04735 [Anaerobiospirillum succiniciproducens]|uniref:hypothetical protein n=1 Tax=Anaerobiospirillum succiniciproducens TaxID=13335 RepID=UPI0026DBC87B|nr:hypothetical protein [Anaerobiospirillum succiniciproducens]MDO4675875.1 hypothetical protein [Anaerobiospirillum succiniciproducens]
MALFKACLRRNQLVTALLLAVSCVCAPSFAVEKVPSDTATTSAAADAKASLVDANAAAGKTIAADANAAAATGKATADDDGAKVGAVAESKAGDSAINATGRKKTRAPDEKALRGESADPESKNITIERTFSVSHIRVPKRCEDITFKPICTRLVNYYARRFERDMVTNYSNNFMNNAELLEQDNFLTYQERERGEQHVTMSAYSPPGDPIMTLFTIFKQRIPPEDNEILIVETINFDSRTGKFIPFKDLFENHELAAMLCARAIEQKYQKYNSKLLPVVISATQLRPSNFIVTANGLRFFFAPGLVKEDGKSADSIFIKIDKLKAAKPHMKWWEGKARTVTQAQRESIKNSNLSSVIDLDEADRQLQEKSDSPEKP